MLRSLFVFSFVLLLCACGDYQREVVTLPTNYSVNQNHLTNGSFDIWQRGPETEVPHRETKYLADRWYVTNDLGPGSVLRYAREKGLTQNSKYAARVEVKQTPQMDEQSGAALYQTLEAWDSQDFIGKTASFSVMLKAVGRVNRVGLQLMYSATEVPVSLPLGSEEVFDISGDSSVVKLQGVSIGEAFSNGGTVGVRIRVVGVSEGHNYDRGNGFVADQAILNLGPLSADFQPKASSIAQELKNCQRYFEKTYDLEVAPGFVHPHGQSGFRVSINGDNVLAIRYSERKRIGQPLFKVYNPRNGEVGTVSHEDKTKNSRVGVESLGESEAILRINNVDAQQIVFFHWASDAEIYPAVKK